MKDMELRAALKTMGILKFTEFALLSDGAKVLFDHLDNLTDRLFALEEFLNVEYETGGRYVKKEED